MRARSSLLLAAALASLASALLHAPAARAATIVRGPYVQDLGSRQAAVMLELGEALSATLEIRKGATGPDTDAVVATATGPVSPSQELVGNGLEPATSYRYLVKADALIERGTFTTAPEDDRPFSFVVYGDNRSDAAAHAAIARQITQTPGDFLVNTGDMVYDGSAVEEWNKFFAIEREMLRSRCLFPAIGNHEIALPMSDGALRYARAFRVPGPIEAQERWYSFRWGSARFFVLDAHDDFASAEQTWLERSLTAADAEPGLVWRFVVLHHGPYSSGPHGGNPSLKISRVPELLRAHKVDVVFAGHDHVYERGDTAGLRWIVSGGGGAPLYKRYREEPGSLRFEATFHFLRIELTKTSGLLTTLRPDGSLLERCAFPNGGGGGWGCNVAAGAPPPTATGPAPALAAGAPPAPAGAAPPDPGNSANSPKKSCSCSQVGGPVEWLGLAASTALVAGSAVRRKRRKRGPEGVGGGDRDPPDGKERESR
jgi:hypothetical protein